MDERDLYAAQNEIYDSGFPLPDQNTGQPPIEDTASVYQPPEPPPDPPVIPEPVEIISYPPEPEPTPEPPPEPVALPEPVYSGVENQIIDNTGGEIIVDPVGNVENPSIYQPPPPEEVNPVIEQPIEIIVNPPEEPIEIIVEPVIEPVIEPVGSGVDGQIIDGGGNVVPIDPIGPTEDPNTYQPPPAPVQPAPVVAPPQPTSSAPPPLSYYDTQSLPVGTVVTATGADGVVRFYQSTQFGWTEITTPPSSPTGPSDITGPIAPANPTGPAPAPRFIGDYNSFDYAVGAVILAYDASGTPRYYQNLGFPIGWIPLDTPVPGGTPPGPAQVTSPPPPVTPVTNCAPLAYQDTGIPSGLSYGSSPGQYTLETNLSAQVSNITQFGEITTANPIQYGYPPATYYKVNSVTPISSSVNAQGQTVCIFLVNFDRASRNPDQPEPPPPPPGEPGAAPIAGNLTITVVENSTNNLVTLPVTGDYTVVNSISPTYVVGSTFVLAGTSNPLQYYYTPLAGYVGGDSVTYSVRGPHGTSQFGQIIIRVTPSPAPPPPPPPPPVVSSFAITVDKNSSNNPVTLVVTSGTFTRVKYVSPTRAAGGTFVSAGTSNPLEYRYTPPANFSGGDAVTYQVEGPNGVSNFGQVSITVNTGPIIVSPSFSFPDLGLQAADTQLDASASAVTGSFLGEWNMALFADNWFLDPPGSPTSPQYYDNLYVVGMRRTRGATTSTFLIPSTLPHTPNSLRVGVLPGDIITPIIRTPCGNNGAQTVVRFRARCSPPGFPDGPGGGYDVVEDTFTVRVAANDIVADAFDFANQSGLEVSTTVETNDITVSGISSCAGVPVKLEQLVNGTYGPAGNLLIDSGAGYVLTGYSSFVYLGNKIKCRLTSPSTFFTTHTYRVTLGTGVVDSFTLATRPPELITPDFEDRTGLEINQTINTNTIALIFEGSSATLTVDNSATIVLNGVDTGLSTTVVVPGQSVAIRATSSGAYSSVRIFTVTLIAGPSVVSDTFRYVTRAARTGVVWTPGDFIDVRDRQLSEVVTSNTLTASDFDLPITITLTNDNGDATAVIFKNGSNVGTSTTINNGDTVAIRGTNDSNEYYKTTTYTITYSTGSINWSATTKHNDHMILFDPY